ncbi:MAG: DapH/DapD/GlmU-related protein [Hyphomicrobiaceae bacterium]
MTEGFAAERRLRLDELLLCIGKARLSGRNDGLEIEGVAPLQAARPGYLTFYSGRDMANIDRLAALPPGAVVLVAEEVFAAVPSHCTALGVPHPRYSFILAARAMFPRPRLSFEGISPLAAISSKATIGTGVTVSPFAVVEDEAVIGDSSVLYPGVHIGRGVRLDERVTILSGTIVGCPGQASERDATGIHQSLPHLASVTIGAETTIGANSVVVQGSLGNTRIGARCTIGNLVNIGHNVIVEDDCFVSAGTVVAGSAHLERGAWLAPGVTVLNKIRIGSEAVVGLGSVVAKDLAGGAFYAGNPARELRRADSNTYNEKRATS